MRGPIMGCGPKAVFTTAAAVVAIDGNSIIADGSIAGYMRDLPPISGGLVVSHTGIGGQTIRDMINSPSDINAMYSPTKECFLIVFEGTNSIFNEGRTGVEAAADLAEYIAARQAWVTANYPAGKLWRVVPTTAIPRGSFLGSTWDAVTGETQLQAYNAYIRANFAAMGAERFVECRRTGGPFDFTDSTNPANFPGALWDDMTHPSDAGQLILAGYINDVLKRMPLVRRA